MNTQQDLIELSALDKIYPTKTGEVHALDNIDLNIKRGEFISIVGPSGCGKTTLLRILAGLEQRSSGSATINGTAISQPVGNVGMVFQKANLLEWRNIIKNVLLPIELSGRITAADRKKAQELLEVVGLAEFARKTPAELSGGMQQRAAICRALVHDPEVLLMDEPFGALDAMTRENLNVEVNRIWRETKKTAVLITHSISEAVFLAQRVIVMSPRPGKIIDDIPIPFPEQRERDLLGDPDFSTLCADIRKHFEVTA